MIRDSEVTESDAALVSVPAHPPRLPVVEESVQLEHETIQIRVIGRSRIRKAQGPRSLSRFGKRL